MCFAKAHMGTGNNSLSLSVRGLTGYISTWTLELDPPMRLLKAESGSSWVILIIIIFVWYPGKGAGTLNNPHT